MLGELDLRVAGDPKLPEQKLQALPLQKAKYFTETLYRPPLLTFGAVLAEHGVEGLGAVDVHGTKEG